jgi:3'-5' exoribonuclease
MIGHLVMETVMVHDHIKQIADFPVDLRRHLLHMLLAHHGKLEYGSPKLPNTPEALMLAYLDDLDSKVEAMQRLIAEPQATGDWTRMTQMFERPIYRNRTLEPPAVTEPATPEIKAPAANAAMTTSGNAIAAIPTEKSRKPNVRSNSFNTPFEGLADLLNND